MTEKVSIHCTISGKVQGVWFRAKTQEEAERLHITGFVKNLPDGRVEVFATGEKKDIAKLYEWLKQGPKLAQVTDVFYEEIPLENYEDFEVR